MSESHRASSDRNAGGIVEYRATIAVYPERAVLEPEPALAGWTTFVSHRAVRAIAVAPVSQIAWIATWGGVLAWNRKDDYVYRRYSSEHGLAGTPSCIAVADDDTPWVGHAEGGLSFFDGDRWVPYAQLRDERVVAIAAARGGRMWVATPDAVVFIERPAPPVTVVRGHAACAGVTALLADGDGVLIASPSGLYRASERQAVERIEGDVIGECTALARAANGGVIAGTQNGVVIAGQGLVKPSDGAAAVVIGLAPTRGGVWILTPSGLARVEGGAWRSLADVPANIATPRAIAAPRPNDDYVWVGTDDLLAGARASGDAPWDVGLLPHHPEDALNNIGRCAIANAAGQVFVGTAGGLFVAEPDGSWSLDAELGDVRSIAAAPSLHGESIWISGWPGGISRLTPGRFWQGVSVPIGLPRAVVTGYDGRPYALVGDLVWRLDAEEPTRVLAGVPPRTGRVVQAPDMTWFAGTDRGLFRYADDAWSLDPALGVAPVASLATIMFRLWAGVGGAVWARDEHGWTRFPLGHNGIDWTEPVTVLAPSVDHHTMWVACGGRVARVALDTAAVLDVYDRFDSGVCGNAITAIAEVDGVLWVVSRAGIARLTLRH